MRRIAILTAIAIAAPVAAVYAQPRGEVRVEVRDRPDGWRHERYDHYGRSRFNTDFRGRWVSLGRGFNASSQRQLISVNGQNRFSKIRIEGVRGEPMIQKVLIEFAGRRGGEQAVEFNESLPNGAGEVIDLNGDDRRINRIIVYTDPRSRGSYSVYGG
jgi:hypothetical protein